MKKFFTPEEFNKTVEVGNCLKFALMQEDELQEDEFDNGCWKLPASKDPDTGRPLSTPDKAFSKFAERRGLKVKLVSSIEETEGKVSFLLWGWYNSPTILGYAQDDFHIVRKNADGTYVHKADNTKHTQAVVTTLDEVFGDYDDDPYIFVLEVE